MLTNWAQTIRFAPASVSSPVDADEVAELVVAAARAGRPVRVLGTGHSFSPVADTEGVLIRSERLRAEPRIGSDGLVRCGSGTTFSELALVLHAAGRALPNLGSLPHISIGGAVATGTHGSGVRNQVLAAGVAALEVVRADGRVELVDGPALAEQAVGVGALGVVTAVTLRTVPAFDLRQVVHVGPDTATLLAELDHILAAGYSVSVFTDSHEIWVKAADTDDLPDADWLGARRADVQRPAGPGADPAAGTEQLGVPGPWHERLPHFRAGFRPSNGAEIQSEFFVARADGAAALAAVCALGPQLAPALHIGEIRSVAADDLLLSPAAGRDTVAIHFTWRREPEAVQVALALVEAALAPFGARPHWGKVFRMDAATVADRHPGVARFGALRRELDPEGRFGNAFVDRFLPRA